MSARRRRWPRVVAILLGVWAAFAAWLLGTAWKRAPEYVPAGVPDAVSLVLSDEAYGNVIDAHARPYVFELAAPGGGRVVVFGAEHTKDPADPQLEVVRARWRALQPTVALVEGRLGTLFPAFMEPVRTLGEAGLVHALARADSARTWSWEPPVGQVIESALEQGFTPEQVALRWVLNPYFSNLRHGRPEDPGAFVRGTLPERSRTPGLAGGFADLDALEAAWTRAFPEGPDWRDVSDRYGLPGFLGEIDLNRARDVHLVACVAELVGSGSRHSRRSAMTSLGATPPSWMASSVKREATRSRPWASAPAGESGGRRIGSAAVSGAGVPQLPTTSASATSRRGP